MVGSFSGSGKLIGVFLLSIIKRCCGISIHIPKYHDPDHRLMYKPIPVANAYRATGIGLSSIISQIES